MNKSFLEIQSDLNILQSLDESSTDLMMPFIMVHAKLESKNNCANRNQSLTAISDKINPYLFEATKKFKNEILLEAIRLARSSLKQQAIVESATALAILNAATN
jgi:hypothetical protein